MRRSMVALLALSLVSGMALAENTDKEAEEAVANFKKAYASKDESARVAAVEGLASTQNHRVVDALAAALKDKEPSVRRAAAKVIGGQWDKSAAATLLRAINPDDPAKDVQVAIINALGETENEQAVPVLISLLTPKRKGQQEDTFTGPAINALKRIGSFRATEDLVTFLTREQAGQGRGGRRGGGGGQQNSDPLTKEAESALQYITGQHFSSAMEWRKWWNENKDTLKTVPVYRCRGTGQKFDKTTPTTKCPYDGDQHSSCGYLLKTRFQGGAVGSPDSGSSSSNEPKHKKGNKGGNNNN